MDLKPNPDPLRKKNHRVCLIDSDAVFLEATARRLHLGGYEVLEYRSTEDFLNAVEPDWKGCVVADLRLPRINGLALQQELKKRNSLLPIIFFTAHGSIPDSVEAMRQGAEDFLTKDTPWKHLVAAIDRAFARHDRLWQEREKDAMLQARLEQLTPREREVLQLVVQGWMNKQIAARLAIHERTVKLHRASGMRKMGVSSVAELTLLWCRAHAPDETDWPLETDLPQREV
jgi:RNA polymerase sigma factor (sigma-70 family)